MITEHDQKRIDRIQAAVNFHRDALTDLMGQMKDNGAREQIRLRLHWVNDIESVFLRSARTERRDLPGRLSKWLDSTEMILHRFTIPEAERIRKLYIEAIKKYGADFETRKVA